MSNGIKSNNPMEEMMGPFQTRPYMLSNEEGQLFQSLGALVTIKATSEQTGGAFNLFEVSCPRDYSTPLHIHYTEDVTIYVLEGILTFFWGSEKREAAAGVFFYQPRGTPHGFRVEGGAPARILYMTMPAGFDRFVLEHELRASESEPEVDAARYKIEILGSLPNDLATITQTEILPPPVYSANCIFERRRKL